MPSTAIKSHWKERVVIEFFLCGVEKTGIKRAFYTKPKNMKTIRYNNSA
jgi:hypothetical protein